MDFHLPWGDYKEGFGDLNGEFWLGNEIVHQLTKDGNWEWYFKATAFDNVQEISRFVTVITLILSILLLFNYPLSMNSNAFENQL